MLDFILLFIIYFFIVNFFVRSVARMQRWHRHRRCGQSYLCKHPLEFGVGAHADCRKEHEKNCPSLNDNVCAFCKVSIVSAPAIMQVPRFSPSIHALGIRCMSAWHALSRRLAADIDLRVIARMRVNDMTRHALLCLRAKSLLARIALRIAL